MQASGITQAEQSRGQITQALLNFLKNNEFHDITILQICQEAGLSRRTFYRHFRTKEEVLRSLLEQMLQQFSQRYDIANKSLEEELYCSFDYFNQHRDLLKLLYRHRLFHLIKDLLEQYMGGACTREQAQLLGQSGMERYFESYYAGSFSAILELWVRDGFDKTPAELSSFTCSLHVAAAH